MDTNTWKEKSKDIVGNIIESEKFPCLFARKSWKSQNYNIAYVDYNENGFKEFFEALKDYTSYIKETDIKKRLLYPLIVIFKNSGKYHISHNFAWDALHWAIYKDDANWPDHINIDPDNSEWSVCFNSVELFINISSPLHKKLKSRNLGDNLVLIINPRNNFDFVANGNTKEGMMIRDKIRNRIKEFNSGFVSEDLGYYGDINNLEWKQYQLEEDDLPRPTKCPIANLIKFKNRVKR